MNHTEAMKEIIKVVPDAEQDFKSIYKTGNAYMVIHVFTKKIKTIIINREHLSLIKCLRKMNQIYKNGDLALKNAVESVFIYSLDSLTFPCEKKYRQLIFEKIPVDLQKAYFKQVYKSGI